MPVQHHVLLQHLLLVRVQLHVPLLQLQQHHAVAATKAVTADVQPQLRR